MDSFALSDVGISREINQDAVFAQNTPAGRLKNLFVVADGMGGHQAGDFASVYSVMRLKELAEESTEERPGDFFVRAFSVINDEVYRKGNENPDLRGMGTTLVACTIDSGNVLTVANVGDSRLYVFNPVYGLRQVTKDHSFVEEMVRKGQMTRGSALYNQSKNIITRAIGAGPSLKTDVFQIEVEPGEKVLLCSDGLSNMVPDSLISLFLAIPDTARGKAETLVSEANQAGGLDNISAVVICFDDELLCGEDDFDDEETAEDEFAADITETAEDREKVGKADPLQEAFKTCAPSGEENSFVEDSKVNPDKAAFKADEQPGCTGEANTMIE